MNTDVGVAQPTPIPPATAQAVEEVRGRAAVCRRIAELTRSADAECVLITSDTAIGRTFAGVVASRPVTVRVVFQAGDERSVSPVPPAEAAGQVWSQAFDDLRDHVRVARSLPTHMLLVDRAIALVRSDPGLGGNAVQLSGPGIVAGLVALGDRIWAESRPWRCSGDVTEQGLTRQEQQLLRLLAAGFTDSAASSRLGLSLRTVRRMMADLAARLDARGRFAVGAESVRRGWI